jgi:hypothetical protein
MRAEMRNFILVLFSAKPVQINLCFGNAILGLAEYLAHYRVHFLQLLAHVVITLSACLKPTLPAAASDFTHAAVAEMLTVFKTANAINSLR